VKLVTKQLEGHEIEQHDDKIFSIKFFSDRKVNEKLESDYHRDCKFLANLEIASHSYASQVHNTMLKQFSDTADRILDIRSASPYYVKFAEFVKS